MELMDNINAIENEKNTKILPSNIRKGVTILRSYRYFRRRFSNYSR